MCTISLDITPNIARHNGEVVNIREVIDRLILKDSNGNESNCLIHGHDFKVGGKRMLLLLKIMFQRNPRLAAKENGRIKKIGDKQK